MTKQEVRKQFLTKRLGLTKADCTRFSLQMCNLFFSSIDISFVKVLHSFLPIEKNNEPDTWLILERIRREFPHIRISVPRIADGGELENIFFEGLHQLKTNSLGIQEPKQGVPTPVEKIDLVLVPLLAVDAQGHRVGYGHGFYDRFLMKCRPDCMKLGYSFFDPAEEIGDVDVHDVKLNGCVTPNQVFTFDRMPSA